MKEQLISFETAKLAKEKGFNIKIYKNTIDYELNPPTQSLLQKWLREVHKIHIEIEIAADEELVNIIPFIYQISIYKQKEGYFPRDFYNTYEEALEEGLLEALKLIK